MKLFFKSNLDAASYYNKNCEKKTAKLVVSEIWSDTDAAQPASMNKKSVVQRRPLTNHQKQIIHDKFITKQPHFRHLQYTQNNIPCCIFSTLLAF